jgi:hypothetical protein
MAREFKAFTRARQIKTPGPLLRVVLLCCGLDKSLREVAGHFTLLVERITDTSVAERLAACRPWVRALLTHMLPRPGLATLWRRTGFWSSTPAASKRLARAARSIGCTCAWRW